MMSTSHVMASPRIDNSLSKGQIQVCMIMHGLNGKISKTYISPQDRAT